MLLIGVKEQNSWLLSRWNLTYPVGWTQILKAACAVYGVYDHPEILVGGRPVEIENKEKLLTLGEGAGLTIRGISTIFKLPVMISFVNQTQVVDVNVAMASEEFARADYERFNRSMGQYMDSIELAMYR